MSSVQGAGGPVVSITEVAAAVIERADGSFLLAQRPAGKPYSGYWEFPGGKIEAGETPAHALARELEEELGIAVRLAHPWITRVYAYTHATVRLHFFRVVQWSGEPHGREHQSFEWQWPGAASVSPMLPANAPVLAALALPKVYAISNAAELGEAGFLRRLDTALATGLKLIQFREKEMPDDAARRLLGQVLQRAHTNGARVLVNSAHGFAGEGLADGVHLSAGALVATSARPRGLCAASTHTSEELRRAADLGCDFAVLGPVAATPSHPGGKILGWEGMRKALAGSAIPIYALGGMQSSDLDVAWRHGAHGVAMMRAVWGQ